MIYKFRIIVDTEEDIFRDVEIKAESTFEDFHTFINTSFGFGNNEMACFYVSNEEWEQGEEIMLFSMDDEDSEARIMKETLLKDVVYEEKHKLIYIYDFLRFWTFYVTLIKIAEEESGKSYPNLLRSHGTLPEAPPYKQFEGKAAPGTGEDAEDDLGIQPYDDLDFDEHWN